MGYQQGLSGLTASANELDVIGNNIANANTVGFKQGQAQFADMYANSVATAVNNQIGLGTKLGSVQQQFGQGTITTTSQALDVAINGSGFYQMSNNGAVTYTRNGVFQLDKNGNIVNAQGLQLMGYAANAKGVINSAATVPLTVPTANIAPGATANITAQFNLNSQDALPITKPFNYQDPTSYNYSTSINAYDSLGGTQQVNMYFAKTASGTWEAYSGVSTAAPTDLGAVSFNTAGNLAGTSVSAAGAAAGVTSNATGRYTFTIPTTGGSTTPQSLTLNLSGTTQYGGKDGVTNLTQDGFATGQLTGFTIGTDGTLTGNYSNGQTAALGQIVLANFNNPNGLVNLGGNQFQQTSASGVPQVSTPGTTNHGTLQGGAVENSNVDLTGELVNLITAQRNYQANSQTLKTQKAVDQTILSL
jgi:flagellar hook protein FlgE